MLHLLGLFILEIVLHRTLEDSVQRERDPHWMQPAPHCNASNTTFNDTVLAAHSVTAKSEIVTFRTLSRTAGCE